MHAAVPPAACGGLRSCLRRSRLDRQDSGRAWDQKKKCPWEAMDAEACELSMQKDGNFPGPEGLRRRADENGYRVQRGPAEQR